MLIVGLFSKLKKNKIPEVEEKEYVYLETIGTLEAKYVYTDVDVAGVEFASPDLYKIKLGDALEFTPEPENEHDSKAVRIDCDGQKLGYVHKGNMQSMIADWQKRKDMILTSITKIDRVNKSVKFGISFYVDNKEE